MKTKKWLGVAALVAVVVAVIGYNYIYKDHRDITAEEPAFTVSAEALLASFKQDENAATTMYLNKTILVNGTVSDITNDAITMVPGVFFALNNGEEISSSLKMGDALTIKGRCIGYDSLLEEIKFDQSNVTN